MFICAGEIEQFDFAVPIGIGMVDASMNLTRICIEKAPESLVFVGTAGSYGHHHIYDIVEATTAVNIEVGFFEGKSYTPIPNRIESILDVSRETLVNSSNYITTDLTAAQAFMDRGIGLENMEFYAVLKVARLFNIPASGIFTVTNYCHEKAHEEFLSHRREAMEHLSRYVKVTNV